MPTTEIWIVSPGSTVYVPGDPARHENVPNTISMSSAPIHGKTDLAGKRRRGLEQSGAVIWLFANRMVQPPCDGNWGTAIAPFSFSRMTRAPSSSFDRGAGL